MAEQTDWFRRRHEDGRRVLMSEPLIRATVELDLDDTGYYENLKRIEYQTTSTLDRIGRKEVVIPVEIEEKDLNRQLRALSREINQWKRERDSLGKDADKAYRRELSDVIDIMETERDRYSDRIDDLRTQRESLAIIDKAKTLEERRAAEAAANAKREEREARAAEDRATRDRRAEELHNEKMATARARTANEKTRYDREEEARVKKMTQSRAVMEEVILKNADLRKHIEENAPYSVISGHVTTKADDYIEQRQADHDHQQALERAEKQLRKVLGIEKESTEETKKKGFFGKLYGLVTNSDNLRETIAKTMREPVRIGPFSATVKGLITAMSILAPLVTSVIGGVSAMVGAVGGALTGAFTLATAGALGFGQGLLGTFAVIQPVMKEFHDVSLVTDAYAKAVQKYGENSKQANKAQQAMNNTLKAVSPTARGAYKDLAEVQKTFESMTAKARPAVERMMASAMHTFRSMAPSFAKNTVKYTEQLSDGVSGFFGRMRTIEKRPKNSGFGGGFLDTTFKAANAALRPLLSGITFLWEGLAKVGASASRYLKPFAEVFRNAMLGFKNGFNDTSKLNSGIDGLMKDFVSVSRAISAATGLLLDFFNSGRAAGRGLFDTLTSTFDRWDRFIKSTEGKKRMSQFFAEAADTFKKIGNAITFAGLALATFSTVFAPVIGFITNLVMGFVKLVSSVMKLQNGARIIQSFGFAVAGAFAAAKMAGFISAVAGLAGLFTKLPGLINKVRMAMMVLFTTSGGLIALAGIVAGLVAYFVLGSSASDKFSDSMKNATDTARGLGDELSDLYSNLDSLKLQSKEEELAIKSTDPKSLEGARMRVQHAETLRQINNTENEINAKKGKQVQLETEAVANGKKLLRQQVERLTGNKKWTDSQIRDYAQASKSADLQKTLLEIEQHRNRVSAQRINAERVHANKGNSIRDTGALDELGALSRQKGGSKVAVAIGLNTRLNDAEIRRSAAAASAALKKGVKPVDVLAALTKSSSVDGLIKRLNKLKATVDLIPRDKITPYLSKLNGKQIGVDIVTKFKNPKNASDVARAAGEALKAGVPVKEVEGIVLKARADKAGAAQASKELRAAAASQNPTVALRSKVDRASAIKAGRDARELMKSGGPAVIPTKASGSVDSSALDEWARNKTVTIKATVTKAEGGMYAEGGVHYSSGGKNKYGTTAAASGYMKDTAYGNARRRPVRRAMGAFREPTLLVGEENQTEFVIATNPAYRDQNKRYLATAAAALGMSVNDGPLAAASGYAPSIIRDAIFSAATTKASLKRDANRIKALKEKKKRYDAKKKHSETAKINHRFDMEELRQLQGAKGEKTHQRKVGAEAANLKRFDDLASKASTDMEIANRRGDARAFAQAKRTRDKYLRAEQSDYRRALKGANVNQAASLNNKISELTKSILDNRDSLFTPAGKTESQQAIIDRQGALITSQKNEIAIRSAFNSVAGGMLFDNETVASGGPAGVFSSQGHAARRSNAPTIVINTLHPGSPEVMQAVATAATGGFDMQGSITSPRVGV